jgi:hypothetical protein
MAYPQRKTHWMSNYPSWEILEGAYQKLASCGTYIAKCNVNIEVGKYYYEWLGTLLQTW